ncbi:MAG: tetratricopeptide repeat protein, partial [Candidatus Acidiferrales bacterium]
SAAAVAQQMPLISPGEYTGSVTVYVAGEAGQPLPVPVDMRLTPTLFGNPMPLFPREIARGWLFENIAAGDTYDLDIEAKGYQTIHQSITLADIQGVSQSLIVYMKPIDETLMFHAPGGQFVLAPRAQKEVQNGLKDFQSGKFPSGEKHLSKALELAPGNPYVNYVAGIGYLLNQQLAKAQPFLEKSVSIDSRQVPALVALGNLRFQHGDYAGAIRLLNQAVQLDPNSWKSHWVLADCYLHEENFQAARDHAKEALKSGKEKADQVELLLGEALAGLGDHQGAKAAVGTFLTQNPHYPNAPAIRNWLESLDKIPAVTAQPVAERTAAPKVAAPVVLHLASPPAPPVELPPQEDWAPKDVDAEEPFVISGATCALPKVLDMAAKNAEKLATNLQEFSATEDSEIVEVKRNKSLETPEKHTSTYMVGIDHSDPKAIQIQELREPPMSPADLPGGLADMGAPGLVLVFHPTYRQSFQWSCEGLGEWKDRPAWIVRFSQKEDRPTSLLSTFETLSERYALPLKGRAWVAANGGQIMHLETDLDKPVTAIGLAKQHFVVDYAPVSFQTHKVTLWLPENVNLYLQYKNHHLHYYHRYSNFQLFWVGASEKISKPKQPTEQK